MIEVHAHDVLFGKGKGSYQHEGNIIYRKLIDTYKVISASQKSLNFQLTLKQL